MSVIALMWEKVWENIIYAPLLAFFFKPVKEKVDAFLKSIWPWYQNTMYRSIAANNSSRPAIFTLAILLAVIIITSEFTLLTLYDPPITALESLNTMSANFLDRFVLISTFFINILLFILILRLELIHSTIARFNQIMAIIRPNIKPEEYYKIRQKWALMSGANDYNKIIKELFTNHKILLENKDKFEEEVKLYRKMMNKDKV